MKSRIGIKYGWTVLLEYFKIWVRDLAYVIDAYACGHVYHDNMCMLCKLKEKRWLIWSAKLIKSFRDFFVNGHPQSLNTEASVIITNRIGYWSVCVENFPDFMKILFCIELNHYLSWLRELGIYALFQRISLRKCLLG